MSFKDRKRIFGPEKTIIPTAAVVSGTGSSANGKSGAAVSRRRKDQHRPIFVGLNLVSGSFIELGSSVKVTGKVFQKQAQNTLIFVDFKFAPFSMKSRRGYAKDDMERDFSLLIKQALTPAIRFELLPKIRLEIHILCLEVDGIYSCLAQAINCASLALIESGIEMFDIVSAASVGFTSSTLVLDMDEEQEDQADGSLLLASMSSLNQITHVLQVGESDVAGFKKAVTICVDACHELSNVFRESLQIDSLCSKNFRMLDTFFYADSHTKRRGKDEYLDEIAFALNLLQLQEGRVEGELALKSSEYLSEIESLIYMLTSTTPSESTMLMVWILLCNLADPLESNLEKFYKSKLTTAESRYLTKPRPLSTPLFEQALPDINQSIQLPALLSKKLTLLSQEGKKDMLFGALTVSNGLTLDLSIPSLSKKAPSLISRPHNSFRQLPPPAFESNKKFFDFQPPSLNRPNLQRMEPDIWQIASTTDTLTCNSISEEPLFSWDASHATSMYMSEADERLYRAAFEKFISQPMFPADEMPLIEEAELITRLLFVCSGISSDLIVYEERSFRLSVDFLRTSTIGPAALEGAIEIFLSLGSKFKQLSDMVKEFKSQRGLCTRAFAEGLETVLHIIESNLYEIRRVHDESALSILQAADAISSISFVVSHLHFIVLSAADQSTTQEQSGILLIKSIYAELAHYNLDLGVYAHSRYLSILAWVLQKGMVPFLNWISEWLMIPASSKQNAQISTNSLSDFDPFEEFFITRVGSGYKFDSSFLFPEFLECGFAQAIYEKGIWWRKIKDYNGKHNVLFSMASSHSTIDILWPLHPIQLEEYRLSIEQYREARLNEWRNENVAKKLKNLADLEEAYHLHVLDIREKKRAQIVEAKMIEDLKMETEKKRKDLKMNIQIYLQEKRNYQTALREKELALESSERETLKRKETEMKKLYRLEVDDMNKSFEYAFKMLAKKELSLEWRRRRVQLDSIRRNFMDRMTWDAEKQPISSASRSVEVINDLSPPSVIAVNSANDFEDATSEIEEEELSFYSAEQIEDNQEDGLNASLEFSSFPALQMAEDGDGKCETIETVLQMAKDGDGKCETREDVVIPTGSESYNYDCLDGSDESYDIALREVKEMQELDEAKDIQVINEAKEIQEIEEAEKMQEIENIEWVLYPGTIKTCFGTSNEIQRVLEPQQEAFRSMKTISETLSTLEQSLVSIETTVRDSFLNLWQNQVGMISLASLSCFFSNAGKEDAGDIRHHLHALHSFFLFGSSEFCMLMRDRLFKDTLNGLNLNGVLANLAVGKIDSVVANIIRKVQPRTSHVTFDLSGIKLCEDISKNFRLQYQPPSPFDIVITDTIISRYSLYFSFLLNIVQTQEALERIHQSERWKQEKAINRDNGESCIITQFIQLSHVFLSGLERFIFQIAVHQPWTRFLAKVDELGDECSLIQVNSLSQQFNLNFLVEMHDLLLDQIGWRMFLLKDDQRILSSQITQLLSTIISFSRNIQGVSTQSSIPQLYFTFHSTYTSFIRVLKDAVSKEEFGGIKYPDLDFKVFHELLFNISGGIF